MVGVILEYLKALNNSKFFAGLVMIMLNIGSKYVTIELSKNQEQYLKNKGKEVMIKTNDGKRISGILKDLLSNDYIILDVKKKIKNTKKYSLEEIVVSLNEIKETKLKINFK